MAIDYAKQAYGRLGNSHVSSAHLVLGLLTLNGGVGDGVLKRAGLSAESVEKYLSLKRSVTEETTELEGAVFGRSTTDMLARAGLVAADFNHTILGVEHLALALLAEPQGEAADLFASFNVDRDNSRKTILDEIR